MGDVYLAVRDDEHFHKRVAIKLLRRDLDTAALVQRFQRERQILAGIDHPLIAKLLDGGATPDGRPYLVMEYIEGQPVDEYCDLHRLTVAQRLTLFREVCAAAHFAHQNLVVHRDIKPANILVTRDGTPRLLDFGIAKLLNPDLSLAMGHTRVEERLLTPQYASPEQVRGDPITTASDVYSLGVLLYELLSGHRPYQLPESAPTEVTRIICEQEPSRPSTAVARVEERRGTAGERQMVNPEGVGRARQVTPERLRRQLRGDLDSIALMALRKEPQRRYASAEQLSEDVRRYLEGRPVRASKATFSYSAGKFLRRHRAGAVAAVAVVAALVVFSLVTLRERQRAEREAARARSVVRFLTDTLAAVDPRLAQGSDPTVRDVLNAAERRLDTGTSLSPQEDRAFRSTIAETRLQLGHYPEALRQFARLRAAASAELGASHPETLAALVGLAEAEAGDGDLRESERHALEALEAFPAGGDEPPAEALRVRNLQVELLLRGNRLAEAETRLDAALAFGARRLPPDSPERFATRSLLAQLRTTQSRFAEAEAQASAELRSAEAALGMDHPATIDLRTSLIKCLSLQSKFAEVLRLQSDGVARASHVLGEHHPVTLAAQSAVAYTLRQLNRLDEATGIYAEVLQAQTRRLGPVNPATLATRHELALLAKDRGRLSDAESGMRDVARLRAESLGPDHPDTLQSELMIAVILFTADRLRESGAQYAQVLPRLKAASGESSGYLVGLSNYAGILYRLGDLKAAESLFRQSLDAHRRILGDRHFGTYYTAMELGTTLVQMRRFSEAEPLYLEALTGFESILGSTRDHPRILGLLRRLAELYDAWGRPEDAARFRAERATKTQASARPAM